MSIGRPDYFSQPSTLRYGTSVKVSDSVGSLASGEIKTISVPFTGVLHEVMYSIDTVTLPAFNLAVLIVDSETVVYSVPYYDLRAGSTSALTLLLEVVNHNRIDDEYAWRLRWGRRVESEVRFEIYSMVAGATQNYRVVMIYEDIES